MNKKQLYESIGGLILAGIVLGLALWQNANAQVGASCALNIRSAYRTAESPSVYYISDNCQKRPIRNPDVFFSHFSSWNDVKMTSAATLASIPDSPLSFLPWGTRRTFQTGSLIKTVNDPRIYFVTGNTLHPISAGEVYSGLGFDWSWVEDVDQEVIARFTIGDALNNTNNLPSGLAIRYPGSPRIYFVEQNAGQTERRYVDSIQQLQASYRLDRIVTVPDTRVIPETTRPAVPAPSTSATTTVPVVTPPTQTLPIGTPVTPSSNTAMVPLTDLLTGQYLGQFQGGLYPNGSNYAPTAHNDEAVRRGQAVQPVNGKVVMISIGMSNTNQEFCSFPSPTSGGSAVCNSWSFAGQAAADTNVNHSNLTIVNCARGGQSANVWIDARARNTDNGVHNNYDICDGRLTAAGATPSQVQVAWVKVANPLAPSNGTSLPGATTPRVRLPNSNADAYLLEQEIGQIVRALKVRYPNIKQVYLSSRIYGGYATTDAGISPEPYAYEGGFAVKWAIQAQIDQMNNGGRVVDTRAGDLNYATTPVLLWGPYLWANGTTARVNTVGTWDLSGLTWPRADIESDATHPSDSGERKVGEKLLTYFLNSPYSCAWFRSSGCAAANTPPPTTNNVAPTVSITGPVNNSTVTAGSNITLTATASDSDGTIASVEFLNGSTVLGSDATSPYSYAWNNVAAGTYTITARATDNRGTTGVSSAITITVSSVTEVPPVAPPPVSSGGQINTANTNAGMGTNVTQFREWASEFTFKDAFRRARNWTCSGSCTYDANGWPTSGRASTILFTGGPAFLNGKYPSGQYVVLYEGTGTISYSGSAVKNTASSQAGRDIVDVNSQNGSFNLTVNGSVRNIRVIMPGGDCGDIFTYAASASECASGTYRSNEQTYETQPFHSLYLQRNKNYKSIRFTWWMLADPYVKNPRLTAPISWSQRPKMTDAIWVGKGVPVEAMVQLANTLNVDPWFNIPHLTNDLLSDNSSDPYVAQFAAYVRDHLNSNLKAYVEYSNEVWNGGAGGYEQAEYAKERGLALGLGPSTNAYLAQLRYQSQQSVRLFRIWNTAYGGRSNRIVRVMAVRSDATSTINGIETDLCGKTGSLNYPWSAAQMFAWQGAYREADAIAIAPYFNVLPADETTYGNGSIDQLFTYINNTLIPRNILQIQANAALARDCGKELLAYEGGNHLVERGANQTNAHETALYNDANRDARMGTVYTSLFNAWKQNGGHLFEHFVNTMQQSSGGVGRFGALESLLDSSSPKYDAIMNFIRQNPKWW